MLFTDSNAQHITFINYIDFSDPRAAMIYNNVLAQLISADAKILSDNYVSGVTCSYEKERLISETRFNMKGYVTYYLSYNFRGVPETEYYVTRDSINRIKNVSKTELLRKDSTINFAFNYDSDYITDLRIYSSDKLIRQATYTSMPAEAYKVNSSIIPADKYNFIFIKDTINLESKDNLFCEYFVNDKGSITSMKDYKINVTLDTIIYSDNKINIVQPEIKNIECRMYDGRIIYFLQKTKDKNPLPEGSKGLPKDIIEKMKIVYDSNGLIEYSQDGHNKIIYNYTFFR